MVNEKIACLRSKDAMKKDRKIAWKWMGLFLLLLVLIAGCEKDDPTGEPQPPDEGDEEEEIRVPDSVVAINKFIEEEMGLYYLWNAYMPDLDYTQQPDPFEYFDSLLYKPVDRWSFLTDNYQALMESYQGIEESMGHSYGLYLYSNNEKGVFGIIQFVYPGSPAAEAGLKRGDLFTAINGVDLTVDNYQTLLNNSAYILTVAELQGNTVVPVREVQLKARKITENPILHYDTLHSNGTVIGYLAYKNFLSNYNDSLSKVFSWLFAAGIDEMVLDLRYNNGGAITSMQHLASILAPATQVNNADVIIRDEYNAILTQYFISIGESMETCFIPVSPNLNLNRLYVLTGRNSASASEALIIGLDPYMDVITIGRQTHGKYTGAFVIYDTGKKHNWAMQPIVFKYANSVGYTDFPDGLLPDYSGDDDLFHSLGDRHEELLARAMALITGVPPAVALKSAQTRIPGQLMLSFDNQKPRKALPLRREQPVLLKGPAESR
jgi:carboxyl-terminal processing protease